MANRGSSSGEESGSLAIGDEGPQGRRARTPKAPTLALSQGHSPMQLEKEKPAIVKSLSLQAKDTSHFGCPWLPFLFLTTSRQNTFST